MITEIWTCKDPVNSHRNDQNFHLVLHKNITCLKHYMFILQSMFCCLKEKRWARLRPWITSETKERKKETNRKRKGGKGERRKEEKEGLEGREGRRVIKERTQYNLNAEITIQSSPPNLWRVEYLQVPVTLLWWEYQKVIMPFPLLWINYCKFDKNIFQNTNFLTCELQDFKNLLLRTLPLGHRRAIVTTWGIRMFR